jgi:LysM repeat protein
MPGWPPTGQLDVVGPARAYDSLVSEPPQSRPVAADGPRPADASRTAAGVTGTTVVCPYLLVPGASWRATRALREHRCTAIVPIEAPTLETQRALCLTSAYPTCPRFEAALDARRASWLGSTEALTAFEARVARRVPRVAPITLDRPSAIAGSLSLLGGSRRLARIVLAAAMVGAGGLLLAARFAGGNVGGEVGSSPDPTTPEAVASPTGALAPSSASPSLPVTSTPRPSPATSETPAKTSKPTDQPAATRRYRVKSGDTLSGIAARFGTTVRAIKALNSITDASLIRPGQVLRIP